MFTNDDLIWLKKYNAVDTSVLQHNGFHRYRIDIDNDVYFYVMNHYEFFRCEFWIDATMEFYLINKNMLECLKSCFEVLKGRIKGNKAAEKAIKKFKF
jgi:hypothetical protein